MNYELYHHGILGMHWGIRRFQNKDGSLTAEGIKRYRTDLKFKDRYDKYKAKQETKAAEKAKQAEVKRVEKLMKTDKRKLTAAELEERIGRLAMEQQVSALEASIVSGKDKGNNNKNNNNNGNNGGNKAGNFVSDLAKATIAATGTAIASKVANKIGDKVTNAIFGDDNKKGQEQLKQMLQQQQKQLQNQQKNQQNNQQNNQKDNDPLNGWTDKKVKGDYSAWEKALKSGKSTVESILEKASGKSVADIWSENTTQIRNHEGKLIVNDDNYFKKGFDSKDYWTTSKDNVTAVSDKSFDIWSWSSPDTKASSVKDSGSTTVGEKAVKNFLSGAWDNVSVNLLGNEKDYKSSFGTNKVGYSNSWDEQLSSTQSNFGFGGETNFDPYKKYR